MREWWRGGGWSSAAAVIALLLLGAIDSAALMVAVSALFIVAGMIALPRQRARGAVAVIVATCVALAIAGSRVDPA